MKNCKRNLFKKKYDIEKQRDIWAEDCKKAWVARDIAWGQIKELQAKLDEKPQALIDIGADDINEHLIKRAEAAEAKVKQLQEQVDEANQWETDFWIVNAEKVDAEAKVEELQAIIGVDAVRIKAFERRENELQAKLDKAQTDCENATANWGAYRNKYRELLDQMRHVVDNSGSPPILF